MGTKDGAGEEDRRLFEREMEGVVPLAPDRRGRAHAGNPKPAPRPSRRAVPAVDGAGAHGELAQSPFRSSDSDEHIEFLAPGIDRKLLRRLRRGDYAVESKVDLHGMNREAARAAVERLVEGSRTAGKRCVLIVHGRGLHSKDEIPILKDKVKGWLERGRIARAVLAFASARSCDGGTGALYVLLRR